MSRLEEVCGRLVPLGFSGVVAVSQQGKPVLVKAYGLADRAAGRPMTPETVLSIGSITKQFTAAAIVKLEAQGRLSVKDTIGKFFPAAPADKKGITLHQLLTHTSGLDSDFAGDYEPVGRDEYVGRILGSKLLTPPGQEYFYSNAGYSLLAAIVELASGQGYEAYLNQALFTPAGMAETGYRLPKWAPERIPHGYRDGKDWGTMLDKPWAPDGPWWALRGNGGIETTAGDMLRWIRALDSDAVLPAEARAKLFTPQVKEGGGETSYGYGWGIFESPRGTRVIGHNGGNGVFFADLRWFADEGIVVFMATNSSDFDGGPLSNLIVRSLLAPELDDEEMPPKLAPIESGELAQLAGTYVLDSGDRFVVGAGAPGAGSSLTIGPAGPEAYAALFGAPGPGSAPPVSRAELEKLNERSRAIVDAAGRRDFGPIAQAFGPRMPLERIQKIESEMLADREARLGPFEAARVAGTARNSEGDFATTVEAVHARGSAWLRYLWSGELLVGITASEGPPSARFVPVEGNPVAATSFPQKGKEVAATGFPEFAAWSIESGTTGRVRFVGSPEPALVVGGRTAKKTAPRPG